MQTPAVEIEMSALISSEGAGVCIFDRVTLAGHNRGDPYGRRNS